MGKRYVVLQFDDGDRFDYEPPLLHPADVFLDRFPVSQELNAELGAVSAVEVDHSPEYEGPLLYPPKPVDRRTEFLDAMASWAKRGT